MSCIVVFLVEIVSFLTCTVGKISVLKKQSRDFIQKQEFTLKK